MMTDWGQQEKYARFRGLKKGSRVSAVSDGSEGVKHDRKEKE